MTASLPTIESTGGRVVWFEAHDGAKLRAATWDAPSAEPAGTVLLLNGRTEFIEKGLEPVEELLARGFAVWTLDWRGQGLSQRALSNRHKGHIEDFRQFLDDLALLVESKLLPGLHSPLFLVAHSMGGHIGLRFLHERQQHFAGALFSSPMVDIAADGPLRLARNLMGWFGGFGWLDERYLPGGGDYGADDRVFEDNKLTSDPERFALMHAQIARNGDLALGGATLGWLHAALDSIDTLTRPSTARAIATPLTIASAGDDKIVRNAAQAELVEHLPTGRLEPVPGARHELMIEAEAHRTRFWAAFDRLRAELAA